MGGARRLQRRLGLVEIGGVSGVFDLRYFRQRLAQRVDAVGRQTVQNGLGLARLALGLGAGGGGAAGGVEIVGADRVELLAQGGRYAELRALQRKSDTAPAMPEEEVDLEV